MTDRTLGFTVIMDKERRVDDAEVIAKAIKMIKGVRSVEPVIHQSCCDLAEHKERMRLYDAMVDHIVEETLDYGRRLDNAPYTAKIKPLR